jgi:predicted nucleic acid-binding protein
MIFLDSSYLIGLILKNDSYSYNSHHMVHYLEKENKIINNTVFNEVLNSLSSNNFNNDLPYIKNCCFHLILIFWLMMIIGIRLIFLSSINVSINFSDCTILNTMQNYKINKIASFDSDFDKIKGVKRIYLK